MEGFETGVLGDNIVVNPIEAIGGVCRRHGLGLFIDAVASFGAMPLDARQLGFQAVTVSSNKCMQGVPGIGWSVVQKTALESARGIADRWFWTYGTRISTWIAPMPSASRRRHR